MFIGIPRPDTVIRARVRIEGSRDRAYIHKRLSNLPKWFPGLVSKEGIRGRGLILGIPFREPQHPAELMKMARERGVLLLTAGKDAVRLVPSLNIGKEDVDIALDVIESCLGEIAQR